MFQNLTGWHFLIILVVILLLFGAPKLPALARSLGQSMKILKEETKSDKKDGAGSDGTANSTEAGATASDAAAASTADSGTDSSTKK